MHRSELIRKLLHLAETALGTDPKKDELSQQGPFPDSVECGYCGKPARIAYTYAEDFKGKGKPYIYKLHENEADNDGFWPHDLCSFATYFCTDIDCAKATTLWNQG